MKPSRKLTKIEQDFVEEANRGYFTVDYTSGGEPFAVGADNNSNCFSMNVREQADHEGGATYYIEGD
jgi:hypothetical protein